MQGTEARTYSLDEAAYHLGVSRRTVERLIEDEQLHAYRIRGRIRVDRDSVARYLAEQQAIPAYDVQLQEQAAERRRRTVRGRQGPHALNQLSLLDEEAE